MKKLFGIILLFLLTVVLLGCSNLTTSTSTSTTSDFEIISLIQDKFAEIEEDLPADFSSDLVLPNYSDSEFLVEYFINGIILSDRTIHYQAQGFDETIDLEIEITYLCVKKNFSYQIIQLRDEDLYNIEITNERFDLIFTSLENLIPEVLISDLTLPEAKSVLADQISFSVNKSYIFHNRFIFTFPENDEEFNLSIDVTFNRETRTLILPLIMSSFSNLPKIPEIHIATDNQEAITTKEYYIYGNLDLITYDQFNNPIQELDFTRMRIKLRGNSTLVMPKKPYKIKFDESQFMLSSYAEREWVLLANFADQSLIRNALAYNLSNRLGMTFAPMAEFVDVYINGVYQGNYMLSDQVEVSSNRVNIDEKSTNIDTGYLIEYDMRIYDEGLDTTEENYFLIDGIPFVIKSPDIEDEHYSHNQYLFISSYMLEVINTLKNKEDYSDLIDIDSFIDWFIVNEVLKNVDSGFSSIYFHKDRGEKLKMGPVWDFDLSSGNPGHLQEDLRGPEGWYTPRYDKNVLFMYLMEYDSFKEALKFRWNQTYEGTILEMIESIYPLVDHMARSRHMNFQIWDVIGKNEDWYTAPEILALGTYEEQVYFLFDYLTKRVEWLNDAINML